VTASSGELRLEVVAGKAHGFSFAVDDRLVIGRNSEGPGRLADDPELSRHHAEIARAPSGEFTIKDLSSTNGTFVNGTRLSAPAVLGIGDAIEVGITRLIVRSTPVPPASASASASASPSAPAPAPADVDVRAATLTVKVPVTTPRPADEAQVQAESQAPTAGEELTAHLTIDFQQATAQVSLHGADELVRLVLERGRWRVDGTGA
jgi:predicted component of type VI protein secretion system